MSSIHLPEIPDVPEKIDNDLSEFLKTLKEILELLTGRVGGNAKLIDYMKSSGQYLKGINAPEGVVTADIGTIYLKRNGGAFNSGTSITLYIKETGIGNTGWVIK